MCARRVRFLATPEHVQKESEYFKGIDKDGNGTLDADELAVYFTDEKRSYLKSFTKLIVKVFGSDGKVSWEQFLKFWKSYVADPHSQNYIGKILFNYIDKDQSGTVDFNEAMEVMELIDNPWVKEEGITGMNYSQFIEKFFTKENTLWETHDE